MKEQYENTIEPTYSKSNIKNQTSVNSTKIYPIIILIFGLIMVAAIYYYFAVTKKNLTELTIIAQQNDSIILEQSKKIKKLELANKNLELYNRDLTTQKKFYENMKPFQQDNILPFILDIESRENQTLKEINEKNQKPAPKKQKFIMPIEGFISGKFNREENHLALDIVSKTGDPVKAIADGTVIFTDWTPDTGFVVIVDHNNTFISVYKHNLDIFKKIGEKIKQGEVISSVGNTGELTTGPHLHLELWHKGIAVDPQKHLPIKNNSN